MYKGWTKSPTANFTATGRSVTVFKVRGLSYQSGAMYSTPQLLPKYNTNDSINPAIIVYVISTANYNTESEASQNKNKSKNFIFLIIKWRKKGEGKELDGEREKGGVKKIMYMPRREYTLSFTRDERENILRVSV